MDTFDHLKAAQPDPEHQAYAGELGRVIEQAVDTLPDAYRLVFMLRDVEGLSTSETAVTLDLGEEAVKTRLHRARDARSYDRGAAGHRAAAATFQFAAPRCDRIVAAVLSGWRSLPNTAGNHRDSAMTRRDGHLRRNPGLPD